MSSEPMEEIDAVEDQVDVAAHDARAPGDLRLAGDVPASSGESAMDVSEDVRRATARLMDEGSRRARRHGGEVLQLWELAAAQLPGGKLLRPRLLLEAFDALSADLPSRTGRPVAERAEAVRLAAALEVLHFAFLLHDDVIDNDLTRRGRANLVGALIAQEQGSGSAADSDSRSDSGSGSGSAGTDDRRSHWARSTAVLVGDQMLALAHQVFARVDLPRSERLALLDALGDAVAESAVGEFLDVSLSDGIVAPETDVIAEMTRTKTATYSFELPLRAACVLAGAPEPARDALTSAGRHLGIAFQHQDDALSVFGSAAEHGKDPSSDLREGKQTAITDFARGTPDWPLIEAALGSPDLCAPDGRHVRSLLADCGAEAHVQALAAREVVQARAVLAEAQDVVPAPAARVLGAVIEELDGRSR
ncbi:polyprenyl synthetase family protein [Brachybacterium sp. MASK1Z-5]|uniref:Polyprenyl synthetase family protein n=1 Tax=Brachybacterium halotolerans TaxID=2795215 RepID=A0ABS1B9K9_9MICO|nr:polyprenyl synthetase family protein [Brachybacterium halotolerans]MBK0330867.1 polyprenyl synthetase family protein [Brachybacterium halotolerans]